MTNGVGDGRPEPRIGDVERRAVDARLQLAHAEGRLTLGEYDERAAQCWAARHQAELDVLTADLPQETTARKPPAPLPPDRTPKRQSHGIVGTLGGIAVVGVLAVSGYSVLTAADGVAVFGKRPVTVTTQDRVEVGVLFGRAEVVVPDDVRVTSAGTIVFGEVECNAACRPGGPGAREVVVDGSGAFGKVTVLTETEKRTQPTGEGDG
ncbi:MAG: DUF1707 domain-containing protein [Pseudonocardia sp.]|nr:DUF1707 domain-containing protein [Pseudonocardia sp.]